MSDDSYLVLRVQGAGGGIVKAALESGAEPFRIDAEPDAPEAAEFRVDVERLDARDHAELRRDPGALAVARPMPLALVEPVPMSTPGAAPEPVFGATWGVFALWAERQLQRNGTVNVVSLDAQLRGNTRRLPNASYLDVGDGLIAAPAD